MKADSDGGSGEDQDGSGSHSKVPCLTNQALLDILWLLFSSIYTAEDLFIYLFTEKGQEIQNVPTFQKSVKGKMKQCRIRGSLLCSCLRICLCNDFHFVGQVY